MLQALTWIGAVFASGVSLGSETDPLSARSHHFGTTEAVMGAVPSEKREAERIVDMILDRYRMGSGAGVGTAVTGISDRSSTPPTKHEDPPR